MSLTNETGPRVTSKNDNYRNNRGSRMSVTSISQAVEMAMPRDTATRDTIKKGKRPQLLRPLKKTFSTEFFLRARQWRDVAEFERKELLKVRVYKSLRQVSDGLLAICATTAILSIVDLELHYASLGSLRPPTRPSALGESCEYVWNGTGGYGFRDNESLTDFLKVCQIGVRILISVLTVVTLLMVYWYSELERRLLVVRNHLSDSIGLFSSPLANNLILELSISAFHLPPKFDYLKPEFQLVTFLRLYNMIKVSA